MKGYYFITDSGLSAGGTMHDVRCAVMAGVRVVQYRKKDAPSGVMYREAHEIAELCAGSATRLIINDRVDIALAVGADGVHIGQDDLPYPVARRLLGPERIIGVTVHSLDEAIDAERGGADYLGVSPIFATGTKLDAGHPCGVETLAKIRAACRLPLVAIGGIDLENVDEVISAGADMACAISAVVAKSDVPEEILQFQRKFGL